MTVSLTESTLVTAAAAVSTVEKLAGLLRQLRHRHARRRGAAELSYREIAAETGWSHGIVGYYINGQVLPPTDRFDLLVRLLGATGEELAALTRARDRVDEGRREESRPSPRQLPADVFGFTGRAGQLAALDGLLGDAGAGAGASSGAGSAVVVCALSGTAGVGKTALALHWAHRVADRFPDGQLYLDLRGFDADEPVAPADALALLLRSLGVAAGRMPADVAERAAHYRTLMADRRILVLLDNARNAEQVRALLPGAGSGLVLVTSRDDLAGLVARDGARRVDLDLLTPAESIEVLRLLVGDRVDAEPQAAEELAERCARLPLALRVAAELAAARPTTGLADLVQELGNERRRLHLLDAGGDARAAVGTVFSWSRRHLSEGAARVFDLLGLFPGREFDAYAVAALAGIPLEEARRLLVDLARAHLVQPTRWDRYTMHDLLRAYAATAADRAEDRAEADGRRAALTRLLDHHLHTAITATDTLFPLDRYVHPSVAAPAAVNDAVTDPAAALAWLDDELANLVAVAAHAAAHGWPGHAVGFSGVLWRHLDLRGYYPEALAIHASAVRAVGTGPGRAGALTSLGIVHWRTGRCAEALESLRQALDSPASDVDRHSRALTLVVIGVVYDLLGRHTDALAHHRRALAEDPERTDPKHEASHLTNIGVLLCRLGRHTEAEVHHRRAAAICTEIGFRQGQAMALANLGDVYTGLGRYREALDHVQRALPICREVGDRHLEGDTLDTRGDIYRRLGRHAEALDSLDRSLAIARDIGHPWLQAKALNTYGETWSEVGEPQAALEHHEAALTLASRTGDRHEHVRALCGMAHAERRLGGSPQARHRADEALAILTELDLPVPATLHNLLASVDLA